MTAYAPERGHVIWLRFSPHAGHEQGAREGLARSGERFLPHTGGVWRRLSPLRKDAKPALPSCSDSVLVRRPSKHAESPPA